MNISNVMKDNSDLCISQCASPWSGTGIIYLITEKDGEIIYIGSTINLWSRLGQHSTRIEFHETEVFFFLCPMDSLVETEWNLIFDIKPKYNIQFSRFKKGSKEEIRRKNSVITVSINSKVRDKIKKIMKDKKITYAKLARDFGMSQQGVYTLITEGGSMQKATFEKLIKLYEFVKSGQTP
jgi:DNA-binding Xre family transcriptional regulator